MSIELIESSIELNPTQELDWILDEDGQWFFKPVCLDLKHQSFAAYWYCKEKQVEKTHRHLGINLIQVLKGKLIVSYNGEELHFSESKTVFIAPGTVHSAQVIPNSDGVLLFVILCGYTDYPKDNDLSYSVDAYAEIIKKHYAEHGLSLGNLIVE